MNSIAKAAVAAGLVMFVSGALAQDLKFDQRDADKAATLRQLSSDTRLCASDAIATMLRVGSRDTAQIVMFATRTCGGAIENFLTTQGNLTADQARSYVAAVVQNQLDRTPGLSRVEKAPTSADETNELGVGASDRGDYGEAMRLYREAAREGLAKAQHNIGYLYLKGLGVPRDYTLAEQWFRKAALQGLAPAQYNLGILYEFGSGVQKDTQKARDWYSKAARQGDEGAKKALEDLRSKTSVGATK